MLMFIYNNNIYKYCTWENMENYPTWQVMHNYKETTEDLPSDLQKYSSLFAPSVAVCRILSLQNYSTYNITGGSCC